jgi:hypothetical protein
MRWPEAAVQMTGRSVVVVLEVGEEEPGDVTKTLHERGDPHRGGGTVVA